MELKCVDQIFGLRYKPKRDDYKQVANCKKKARITKIKGQEPKKGRAGHPTTLNDLSKVCEGDQIWHGRPSHQYCQNKEQVKEMKDEAKDEMPAQLSIHTTEDILAKVFVKKLAEGEAYKNLKMEHAHIVLKR